MTKQIWYLQLHKDTVRIGRFWNGGAREYKKVSITSRMRLAYALMAMHRQVCPNAFGWTWADLSSEPVAQARA